jgi:hypothetical protein
MSWKGLKPELKSPGEEIASQCCSMTSAALWIRPSMQESLEEIPDPNYNT